VESEMDNQRHKPQEQSSYALNTVAFLVPFVGLVSYYLDWSMPCFVLLVVAIGYSGNLLLTANLPVKSKGIVLGLLAGSSITLALLIVDLLWSLRNWD